MPASTGSSNMTDTLLSNSRPPPLQGQRPRRARRTRRQSRRLAAGLCTPRRRMHPRTSPAISRSPSTHRRGGTFLAIDRFAIQTLCYRISMATPALRRRAPTQLRRNRTRSAGDLRLPLFPRHPVAAHDLQAVSSACRPATMRCFENGKLTVAPYWQPKFEEGRGESFAACATNSSDSCAIRRQPHRGRAAPAAT